MTPHPIELPEYTAVTEALQALANATGQAWIVTNVPLGPPPEMTSSRLPVDPEQPCMFCGQVH